jgi:hypothetical protein
MTATLTEDGLERLREAYPHALLSARTNVIDHLHGLDLAAFAKAVGSFGNEESPPHPQRRARRSPTLRRSPA